MRARIKSDDRRNKSARLTELVQAPDVTPDFRRHRAIPQQNPLQLQGQRTQRAANDDRQFVLDTAADPSLELLNALDVPSTKRFPEFVDRLPDPGFDKLLLTICRQIFLT
jgi:hypothetical protein